MHSYLRAVGFSNIKKESEVEELLQQVYKDFDSKAFSKDENGIFLELKKSFGPNMGIMLCGDLDEQGFHRQYYFPYLRGNEISTSEDLVIEKRAGGDSFAGVCDDGRVGVSMIFYLQNAADYRNEMLKNHLQGRVTTSFSGLSLDGMILLPLLKDQEKEASRKKTVKKRSQLMNAAKNGDQEAIESLTIEDMDLYSMVSRRIYQEDVFTIIDTLFMPYGIECDQYQIVGNINSYTKVTNSMTGEKVYQMNLECNDLTFDICINESDLLGEPEVGRRFKGSIWLQGKININ